jgi:hypothetical protein
MSWINLSAIWKIVVFGLIAGAGLPALFAGGLYSLSLGPNRGRAAAAGADGGDSDVLVGGSVLGMVLAAIAFLVILAAIGWSIYEIYQIGHPATTTAPKK